MNCILCLVLVAGTHEMEPIEYEMILPSIIYDENVDPEDDWFGLFNTACGSMLRPVEFDSLWKI